MDESINRDSGVGRLWGRLRSGGEEEVIPSVFFLLYEGMFMSSLKRGRQKPKKEFVEHISEKCPELYYLC